MKNYLLSLFLFLGSMASAQDGIPYITHFGESQNRNKPYWAVCQDSHSKMFFASRLGLTCFDGNTWENIKLPEAPLQAVADNNSDRIFVGTRYSFGYVCKDKNGDYGYNSITPISMETGIISSIIQDEQKVLFSGNRSVSVFERDSSKVTHQWFAGGNAFFTGAFIVDKQIFINVNGTGLHRIDSDTLFPIVTGYLTKDIEILFALPATGNRVLVGTDDNRLSLFDGMKYYDFGKDIHEYLEDNILAGGVVAGDSYFAFSTLYGGVVIADKFSGEIVYILNYGNGLPDDEIFAMGADNNEGLWLTHNYGISRVDMGLPLQDYTNYPGLEGILSSAAFYNNSLYVATNKGLYILDEVKSYTEVEVYYEVNESEQPDQSQAKSIPAITVPEINAGREAEDKPLRSIFSRLFSRRTREAQDEKDSIKDTIQSISRPDTAPVEKPAGGASAGPVYQKRTVSKLKSVEWMYRQIDGIDTRCSRLIETNKGLLAISGSGIFIVRDKKAENIFDNRSVNCAIESGNNIIAGTDEGLVMLVNEGQDWMVKNAFNHNEPVYSLTENASNEVWAGGINMIYCFEKKGDYEYTEKSWYYHDSDFQELSMIECINDTIYHFSERGIAYYSDEELTFIHLGGPDKYSESDLSLHFLLNQQGKPWIKINNNWVPFVNRNDKLPGHPSIMRLFDNITAISTDYNGRYWFIDNNKHIYKTHNKNKDTVSLFDLYITGVYNDGGSYFDYSNLVFEPNEKAISISLSAPDYLKETSASYQYIVDGIMRNWSAWSTNPEVNLFLPPGEHNIRLRAKNILGNISNEKSLTLNIKSPFTGSIWFYLLSALGVVMLTWFISDQRQRKLRRDKRILEEKVKERTSEIEMKKKQIERQRDEIYKQKEEITGSITYARRIQEAILPEKSIMQKSFSDHFILYKPRDIVSGDFYWVADSKDYVYFAVADCTGHGVPGAFMSMLGISLLNEITSEGTCDLSTDEILNTLRDKLISALHYTYTDQHTSDGMDIALCKYNHRNKVLEYSGAFNPLLHYDGEKLKEYKADRMPIGPYEKEDHFSSQHININNGDTIYLFSDGYYDQFGGPLNKRFSSRKLKMTIGEIVKEPLQRQKQMLEKTFIDWKGDNEQVDDIIISGLKF